LEIEKLIGPVGGAVLMVAEKATDTLHPIMASILDNAAVRSAALPITVEQYHRLGEAGIIPQHNELLRGVIVEI
jgi:hypothetical protein